MLAVAAVIVATAVEKPRMNVQGLNENQVLVTVQAEKAVDMELTISHEVGGILYYKRSRKPVESFNKIYDLKNLGTGSYKMEIRLGGLITEKELIVGSDKIRIDNSKVYASPFFKFDGKKLVVSHLNFEKEKYRMEIYDENGAIFESSLENNTLINSGFDLSKLKDGEYSVILSSRDREFSYSFEK